jgi:hypothetical protein
MRGQELRSLGFPGVWFVPGCAGPREVSEPAQQVAAPDRPIGNSIEGGAAKVVLLAVISVPPIAHSGISARFWSAKDQDAIALGLPKRI